MKRGLYSTPAVVAVSLSLLAGSAASAEDSFYATAAAPYKGSHQVARGANGDAGAVLDLPMYQIDALVRRAPSLQKTREGRTPAATY